MKSFLHFLRIPAAILLGAALLFACDPPGLEPEPDPDPDPVVTPPDPSVELTLSVDNLIVSSFGGTYSFTVTTNQDSWTATSGDDWISVSISGSKATVTVLENTGGEQRKGKVSVSAGGKEIGVSVSQEAAEGTPPGGESMKVSYTLKEGTTIAPKALASYIKAHNAEALTFTISKDVPKELLPATNAPLIINTPTSVLPGGLLGVIHSVEEAADGYVVEYSKVNFTTIFKDLDLDTDEIDLDRYVTRIEDAEGNEVPFTKTKASAQTSFHINIPMKGWDLPAGFTLTPQMALDIALKMQMIVGDYKISTLNLKVDLDVTFGAELELKYEGSVQKDYKLMSLYFAAIPLGPVVLTPAIDIYAIIGADGSVTFTASATNVLHSEAALHYDEQNGLSGDFKADPPDFGKTRYAAGVTLDGGISYGLGIGPSIGIYTDVIQAGLTVNLRQREGLSTKFDLLALYASHNKMDDAISSALTNAEYSISWLLDASLHFRALGASKDYDIPSITLDGESYKLFPPIDYKDVEMLQDAGKFIVKAKVSGPSMISGSRGSDTGELVLRIYESGAASASKVFDFDLTADKAQALWDDKDNPQTIQAEVSGLENGKEYYASICLKMGDSFLPLLQLGKLFFLDSKTLQAIRGILSDIKACAANEWEGCNWDDETLPVLAYKHVSVYTPSDGVVMLNVGIAGAWQLGENLIVKNHSADLKNFRWWLDIRGNPQQHFDTIALEDVCLDRFQYDEIDHFQNPDDTKAFICHSPYFSGTYPRVSERLDLSGSGYWQFWDESWHEATEIVLDNCQYLEQLCLITEEGHSVASLSAKNCPALKLLKLSGNIDISSTAIGEIISSASGKMSLTLFLAQGLDALTIGNGVRYAQLSNVQTLGASNAGNLEELVVQKGVSHLSVSDCPKLEKLSASSYAGEGTLESFSISGTPNISALYINGHQKLKMTVPAVFDQMRKAGKMLSYDIRYEYIWGSTDEGSSFTTVDDSGNTIIWYLAKHDSDTGEYIYYRDRGYGFYYSYEPGRGYHLKD